MEHPKTYTMEELHKLDPASIIRHENHRPMTVVEAVRHLIDGDWPDHSESRSRTQQEVMAMATSEPTTQQEH